MLGHRSTICAALIAVCGASPAAAGMPDLDLSAPISGPMAEADWDWHPGDLIFRNGLNDLDELVRQAEGGDWATVGILRASSGGPRVVYADETQGVTEVMLSALAGDHQGLRDRLLADWQSHPYCRVAATAQECWDTIRDMVAVATPGAIIASDQVERVFP